MTFEDIKELITGDEHRSLELKKTTGELKDAMHTACAMLNSEGGWLIFGITPTSLKVVGQKVTDNTQREIAQALSFLEPAVDVRIEYVDIPDNPDNKAIAMHFEAFVWGRQPYTYHGCPYYKVESITKIMPRDMFEERLRANKPQYYAWERQKAMRISLNELNAEHIRGAVRLGVERGRLLPSTMTETLEHILDKLQLLTEGVPNNAAAALFGTNIYEYPQFRIRMARFRGMDKNEFIDNQRAEGNFFDLLDAGMQFFFKHLSLSGKIIGLKREEQLEIPVEALREALINALCHRQYEKYNLTIGIAIYDDRIEIENPGVLAPPLTPETIKQPHISYPYNPIMADVLFRTTFLENWGSGASRIIDACRKQNVADPDWTTNGGFVVVTFKRTNNANNSSGHVSSEGANGRQAGDKQETSGRQAGDMQEICSETVSTLINKLPTDYHTLSEMMKVCGMRSRTTFLENYITPALESGYIERKYKESPKHPKQQYRLSDKAIALKNKVQK